jgi:hypothetical protein
MRTLCTLLLLAVVVIGPLGFYFQWWKVSATSGPDHTQIQMNINKEKIREDINQAKQQAGELKKGLSHNNTEARPVPQH